MKFFLFSLLFPLAASAAAPPPIMGWSSWNTYRVGINDSLICRQADALVATGLRDAGYRYVNIDDGFFGQRDSTGQMHTHATRFPRGLRHVADHIHALGMKAGIYSDAGANTCGSIYDHDDSGIGAGLYGHERQDACLYFKEWGFDFIKIDYCGAGTHLNLDEETRYRAIAEAFAAEGCAPSVNICRWAFPGTWARQIATSWRISPDIRPRWTSVRDIVARNLYLAAFCQGGHYNDMDMLEVGRGMSQTEDEAHFALWCVLASPLLIGCDIAGIRPATLDMLKNPELIAINQDPLCLQAHVVRHDGDTYVLCKDLLRRRGRTRAVALYNPSDTVRRVAVSLADLCLQGPTRLRDVVRRADLPATADSIRAMLPPHAVRLLTATAPRRLPQRTFEAENAWLPCYSAISAKKKAVGAVPCEAASGRMVVRYVGGAPENVLQWDGVWREKAGPATLTITYIPAAHREMTVWVNGRKAATPALATEGTGPATTQVRVMLSAGDNQITIGNPYNWTPDIDRLDVD